MRGNALFHAALTSLILLLASNFMLTPLHAQNPQQDVQALLANDDTAAALKQQLTAKQITNAVYTKQAQQLAKDRAGILARYDRAGQRDLTALYRAALNDKRATALEAQRKAAAEAKTKALEDAQAKKAAQQAAAAQAAEEAAAASAKGVDEDAEEYTRLMLRHDELVYRNNMKKATEAEKSEMAQLLSQSEDIKKKYARGGASQAQAAQFETRTKELAAEKIAPAKQEWITASFPNAGQILAGFSSDAQRLAALRLIDTLLYEQAGQPQSPATAAKITGYREEMKKLDPEHDSSKHLALQDDVYKLMHASSFQYEVMNKFAPAFANAPRQAMKQEQNREQRREVGLNTNLSILATGLVMFALPLIYLIRGERQLQHRRKEAPNPQDAFQLPEKLRIVRVFRKMVALKFECGQIYDHKEIQIRTVTKVYNSADAIDSYGNVTSLHLRGSTLVGGTEIKHIYSVRTPDGSKVDREFFNNSFPADKGDIISIIDFGHEVVMALNNSRGEFVSFSLVAAHVVMMMRGWVLLVVSIAIAIAGAVLTVSLLPESEDLMASRALFAIPVVLGVLSAGYLLVLTKAVTVMRKAQFRSQWLPKYMDFMKGLTPQLERFYSAKQRA